MGRKSLLGRPMTDAERQQRRRDKVAANAKLKEPAQKKEKKRGQDRRDKIKEQGEPAEKTQRRKTQNKDRQQALRDRRKDEKQKILDEMRGLSSSDDEEVINLTAKPKNTKLVVKYPFAVSLVYKYSIYLYTNSQVSNTKCYNTMNNNCLYFIVHLNFIIIIH